MRGFLSDADPKVLDAGTRLLWGVIAAMVVVLCFGYWATGLSVDLWSGRLLLMAAPACVGVAWFYRSYRPDPWISRGAEAVAQVLLILILATLITYPAAAANFPYRDAELYALDRMLGFDWRAYLDFFNRHPLIGFIGNLAYFSMKPQTALVIAALVVASRFARLQCFALALAISLAITITIFMFVPAVAYYAHLGVTPAEFANLAPSVPYNHIRHLEGARLGLTTVVRFDDLEGMITFPSFHTTTAILYTWAMWPFRRARWVFLALNVMMVAATPIDGAHYVIDLVGGAVVAWIAVWGAVRVQRMVANAASIIPERREAPCPESITTHVSIP